MRRLDAKGKTMLFMLLVLAGIAAYLLLPMTRFADTSSERQAAAIEQALNSAALQCYALEGSYPPDLAYLAANYGLLLDEDNYYYLYDIFASNVRPEIEVTPKFKDPR